MKCGDWRHSLARTAVLHEKPNWLLVAFTCKSGAGLQYHRDKSAQLPSSMYFFLDSILKVLRSPFELITTCFDGY